MKPYTHDAMLAALLAGLSLSSAAVAETVGTLTLDALSYVSFQDQEILALQPGSTLSFRFGDPAPDGTVPLTLTPQDVSIPPIPLAGGGTLTYSLAAPASGWMESTPLGRKITFTATVEATRQASDGGGTLTYTISFTTETASATNAAGTESVSVSGMRVVEGVWHVQIVGAVTNRTDALPRPGVAVYTVLSGYFDRLP